MWLLTSPTGELIYLKPDMLVSIGRKKGDIILSHDTSISKFHASIIVNSQTKFVVGQPTSTCILKDEGSKYGTFILRNQKFKKVITDINLKDQDLIRIGLQEEIFIISYIPIITSTSGLPDSAKGQLHKIMDDIDGIITDSWEKFCTHLTVLKPKLTEKVAVSLAAGIPIVSIDYWKAVKSATQKGEPLPKTDNYISEISEQYISKGIVSLYPNDKRKTLFTNLIFIFFDLKQYEIYETMIRLAGGKSIVLNLKNKPTLKLQHNFIYVQFSSSDETQLTEDVMQEYDHICKTLKSLKHRVIPESEISLAILYCSIERYCNIKYNFANILKRQEKLNHDLPDTLVIDTQDQELLTKENSVGEKRSCYRGDKNCIEESLKIGDRVSTPSNVASQKILDNEKKLITYIEPTTSKNSSLEIIESEESDSSDSSIIEVKVVKIVKNKSTNIQGTSKTKETQETKVKENLATINSSNIRCSQNNDIKQNSNTSNISIRKRPPGKTFQKAHVKIPIKRIRL
ncbi:nibrin [Vespula maculifrons]|uniref:Nibrin n=1 Tax=Vespula maculifrons TaxID=7453 RepID=A0ABD2ALT2_VESMC